MSIIDTFDGTSPDILTAHDMIQPNPAIPETVISVFSEDFVSLLAETKAATVVGYLYAGDGIPIYSFQHNGKTIGFFRSCIGGAAAAGLLEEITAMGAKKVLYFGSSGSLDKDITAGHLLYPQRRIVTRERATTTLRPPILSR